MKETVENLVLELMEDLKDGKNFIKGELPELANEILRLGKLEVIINIGIHIFSLMLGLLMLSIAVFHKFDDNFALITILYIVGGLASLFGLCVIDYLNLEPFLAPKFYILKQLKRIIK